MSKTGGGRGSNQYRVKGRGKIPIPEPEHVRVIRALAQEPPMSAEKAGELAREIYELPDRAPLFAQARNRYPQYNDGGDDTDDAMMYISTGLERAAQAQLANLSDKDQEKVMMFLDEEIYEGLT